jgi:hypothetical protein
MPTTTKTRRSKPTTKGQPSRGFPRRRRTSQPPRGRPQFPKTRAKPAAKAPSGLIARAQATLPGRKPQAKKSTLKSLLSSLGSARSSAVARKPPKKGIIGIIAGGLGVAAIAKRRRGEKQYETPLTQPVESVEDPNSQVG